MGVNMTLLTNGISMTLISNKDITNYTNPNFIKYFDNPIITVGAVGSWEDIDIAGEDVKWNETTNNYLMVYSGYDGAEWGSGLATSIDLIHWTKDSNNPFLLPNDHEGYLAGNGSIVYVNGTYYYYYQCGENELHAATSTDLVTWTRSNSGNAIMVGTAGQVDSTGIFDFHASISSDGTTINLYHGSRNDAWTRKICLSTASVSNPLSFTKQGIVLSVPSWSINDLFGAPCPIIINGKTYFMHDGGQAGTSRELGWYYPNGSYASKIVLEESGSGWESEQVFDPSIIFKDESFYLFYAGSTGTGGGSGMGSQLGLAIWTPKIIHNTLVVGD